MGGRAITEPLALTTDYVSLDGRYTDANGNPYASVAAAEAALGRRINQYTVGLKVLVKESGWTEAKEYWVQPKGTTPETYGLVDKDGKDLTKALTLSGEQKHNASANINDRAADVAPVTGAVKALGYKVLNPNQSFTSQVVDANTIYEIRDYFDLSGTEQEPATVVIPANCKLRFEGGMLGGEYVTLQGTNTLIESDSVCIQKGVKITGTWGNDVIYTKWLEFVSAKDAYLPAAAGTSGVMAPFFEDNIFFKYGINYVLLIDEPSNWRTDWSNYYEIVNNTYVNVSDVAPEYAPNVYYTLTEDGEYEKLTSDNAPDDWETKYMDYYTDNTGTHVTGVAPEFIEASYYEDAGAGYEELLQQPDDWFANWSNYYIEDGDSYITPNGIIDNPNATNNAIVFKQLQDIINGTKGCKVEFEKGYYQASTLGKAQGTVTISEVEYEVWPTNIRARDVDVVLNIFELPYLDINLNGSTLKALKTNCPAWSFFRFNGIEQLKVHNGEITGYAAQFDYPQYWNRRTYPNSSGTISTNYERVWLLMVAGGSCELYNLYIHNSTGNCISVGKRKWRFDNGDLKSYNVINAYVHDCEFSHCGRNGVGMGSGKYVTLERLHIHHVGSFNGDGTVDTYTNIMGYLPMAGIDVESDEKKETDPNVIFESLKIHNCAAKAFTFATPSKSRMQSFYANNLIIEGGIVPNNMTTDDGIPTITNSKITFSYGRDISLLGTALYENCEFIFKTSIRIGTSTFNNCKFIDNLASPADFNSGAYSKTVYNNCYFLIKNLTNLRNSSFKSCQLEFDERKFEVRVGGSTFDNCTLTALQTIDGANVSFNNANYKYPVNFKNCTFNNIRGSNPNDVSARAFTRMQVSFINCIGDIKLASYDNDILIKDCHGSILSISGYNLATKSVLVSGCDFKSWTITDVPSDNQTFVVEDSKVTFNSSSSSGQCRSHAIFRRCDITYNQTGFSLVSNNQIFDSVVKFANNVANSSSENKISLTNSYIKGAATQAAFKGVATDCTFENNADSGTSAQRPLYNLVIGQKYYDTTLGKPIYWNGTAWMDNPNVRPGKNIPIGFEIYDLELKKPIYWDGYAWRDVNGNYIFDNSGSLQNRLALTTPIKGQQFKLTREGETDVYLIYGDYGWLNATNRSPWFDDSGSLNAMYDKYNYTLLTAEPSNWDTKYNTYYKIVNGVYTKLSTLETWTIDTFYKLDVNTYKRIQVKLTDTDTELYNKVVKWNGTKYINIVDNVALKAGTPTLAFGEVEEEIDGEQVSVTQATITSSTSSGKLYYTKDGNDPTSLSTEYSSAIKLADGDQVKAICIRDHMDNSNISYVPVAKPVITFNDGILHIECDTPDAKIYYTTDGNPPSTTSTVYDSSASVTIATGITVKAFATLIGRVNSEVATKKRS